MNQCYREHKKKQIWLRNIHLRKGNGLEGETMAADCVRGKIQNENL